MQAMRRASSLVVCLGLALQLGACAREAPVRRPAKPTAERAAPDKAPNARPRAGRGCTKGENTLAAQRTLSGKASYYHDSLAGNKTASGQRYRPQLLTAAHRTLPFGTRLRVVRTDAKNQPVVCVTVNDRGPFAGRNRIVDLSRSAAEALGMIAAGVVSVRVEVLSGPKGKS